MPAGKHLKNKVFGILVGTAKPMHPIQVFNELGVTETTKQTSLRSIRYAFKDLIDAGKARRVGNQYGPVEAIRRD